MNSTDQPDRLDADLALVTAFPAGIPTVDGRTYYPSVDKFLTVAFGLLAEEGLGVADGPTFTAHPGLELAAATRLEELFGAES